MKRALLILTFIAMLPAVAAAQSSPPSRPVPYAKLASALGTPDLISSSGPPDKSLLKLRFVGRGETANGWLKMTSISIAKVKPADTVVAARTIIAKFKTSLEAQKHAKVTTFDESASPVPNAFFAFVTSDGIANQGIAYSPAQGFVSVIQVAYKHGFAHGASDRAMLTSAMRER